MGRHLGQEDDPKGLIREAYRIEGITEVECRSILLDWALSLPGEPQAALHTLLLRYGAREDHPMTGLLREGLGTVPQGRRRGRRAER